jgi:hypothetical protein
VERCLDAVVDIVCPKEKVTIAPISLSRMTVTRRIETLSEDIKMSFHELAAFLCQIRLLLMKVAT